MCADEIKNEKFMWAGGGGAQSSCEKKKLVSREHGPPDPQSSQKKRSLETTFATDDFVLKDQKQKPGTTANTLVASSLSLPCAEIFQRGSTTRAGAV